MPARKNAAPVFNQEEIRQRILAVVKARQQVTDVDIWRSDAPHFLPWNAMQREIEALHREQKLRRQIVAPGQILIHSLTAPSPTTTKAIKQPASRRTPKRSAAPKKSK